MYMMPITPERKAQLEDYAQRHGQDAMTALDELLGKYLDWESQEYEEAVKGIQRGYADLQAGRMLPVEDAFEALRLKHGLPR